MSVITKAQMLAHNDQVIKNVLITLVEEKLADPARLLLDTEYTCEMVATYLKAANIAREMMNMPKLYLYEIEEN